MRERAIPPLDFDAWIIEAYVKAACADLGLGWEAEKAVMVDPAEVNAGLPMQIWHARDGISTCPDMAPS